MTVLSVEIGWLLLVAPIVLAVLVVFWRIERQRQIENYYFDRLYWTMRQAQEDSEHDKDKHK